MARPRGDIEPRVIVAARERFLVDGVDGASLRKIAQQAGTSIGMIYYYFPTKDDLFFAVVEDVYGDLLRDISEALRAGAESRERIANLYTRFGQLSDVEFQVLRIVIRELLVSSDRLRRLAERVSRGHLPLLAAMVAEGRSAGELRDDLPVPTAIAALGALGLIPQIARRVLREHAPELAGLFPDGTDLASTLTSVALEGLGGDRD